MHETKGGIEMKKILIIITIIAIATFCYAESTIAIRSSLLEIGPEFGGESKRLGFSASVGIPAQGYLIGFLSGDYPAEGEPFNPLELISLLSYRVSGYWKAVNSSRISLDLGLVAAGFAILNVQNIPDTPFIPFAYYSVGPTLRLRFKAAEASNSGFFVEACAPWLGMLISARADTRVPGLFGVYSEGGSALADAFGLILSEVGLVLESVNIGYTWTY